MTEGIVDGCECHPMHVEHLLDHLDLLLGLAEMRLEGLLELRIARFLDHLRQRLRDLLLRVVDVLQRVDEQVVECLDVL